MGIPMLTVAAISGVLAASASAASEYEGGGGGFPIPFTFQNKTGVEPTLNAIALGILVVVKCKTSSGAGEVVGAKGIAKMKTTYKECKVVMNSAACTSPGDASGEIDTSFLSGKLEYINLFTKTVGIEFKPTTGTVLAEFTCSGLPTAKVEGCVIGQVTPTNVVSTTGEFTFKANSETQEFTKLEGGSLCEIKVFGSKAALNSQDVVTYAKAVSVKA